MAPMQWPETTAVVANAAGFESMSVSTGMAPVAGAPAVPMAGPVMVTRLPGRLDLPCTQDPDMFFAESPADVEYAKALCRDCPARIACFSGALERREPWGVWGGELFLRGEVVPRKRPRGRPRKTDVAA
jgi:WhiB family redox-sensing transcriptional regulator